MKESAAPRPCGSPGRWGLRERCCGCSGCSPTRKKPVLRRPLLRSSGPADPRGAQDAASGWPLDGAVHLLAEQGPERQAGGLWPRSSACKLDTGIPATSHCAPALTGWGVPWPPRCVPPTHQLVPPFSWRRPCALRSDHLARPLFRPEARGSAVVPSGAPWIGVTLDCDVVGAGTRAASDPEQVSAGSLQFREDSLGHGDDPGLTPTLALC